MSRRRFFKYGAPFLIMLVGGSFGLKYFAEVRYMASNKKMLTPEEATSLGIDMKGGEEKPTLEGEYQKLQEIDIDTWENIRGPRPWEDSKSFQKEQREAIAAAGR